MQSKHLNTLEFPKILERLAGYAAFSASKQLARSLQPSPYFQQVERRQTETSEANALLEVKPSLGVGSARDVRPYVERCRRDLSLLPPELLEIRHTLIAARELSRTLERLAEAYPRLADIAQRIEPCTGVVNSIGQAIDDNGEIKSNASPALSRIRRELNIAHDRLLEKLNRVIGSSSTSQYLQESIITQRAGRYVVPVKADFKGRIQGVVHDQSASGATVFVEPLATVELNNKWRQLQLEEDEEIRRILMELSALVADQGEFIEHTVIALAELDLAFAKAKYAQAIDAIEPALLPFDEPDTVKLMAARHPLLDPKSVVPITVTLEAGDRMLVITGPNTGGKTVSLKTIGLLATMAQAGLHIPAEEGSALAVFEQIFADIGDEQSIEQNLSTFSGHMTNIVQILDQCHDKTLVIFDELGAGTDPIEGSALAQAILTDLLEQRVTTFVATHFSELKAFAHTTEGVANASMEFDVETLSPTYRLKIGLPGASNAFTIAQRLGLPQTIIDAAQGLVGAEAQQVEAMLAEIRSEQETAQRLRREAETERQQAEAETEKLRRQRADIDNERRDVLNSARADARREIKEARERIRALEAEAKAAIKQQSAAAAGAANISAEPETTAELDSLEAGLQAETPPPPKKPTAPPKIAPPEKVHPGDKVYIPQFSTTAEVVGIENGQAEVQLGHFRASVSLKELELREKASAQKEQPQPRAAHAAAADIESPGIELDLRGQTGDEALRSLDQYLDRAFLARLPWVHIIHGKGSGVLRQVVREALHEHALVSTYRAGRPGEGGDGVTVARLAIN